jgi:beta-barrel assembly-enhancing protease
MIASRFRVWVARVSLAILFALPPFAVLAQTQLRSGFNLFSIEQDVEIGRQSAIEAERQLPMLDNRSIEEYVNAIGERLASVAPGADYPYRFRIVNASDINAFALPGGYLYLNRGLIEAAENEGQLAGVMAHEMAHVALRHGTSQASKAYLGQAGLGLLGGLLGREDRSTDQRIAAIGGFGLNTLFLKFSRTAEEEADVTGVQILAAAGYDPRDMADFFAILALAQDHEPGKVEQFFSSHPAPANRFERINEEIALLHVNETRPVGGFAQAQSALARMPPAQTMQQIADGERAPVSAAGTAQSERGRSDRQVPEIRVAGPSERFDTYEQRNGLFQIGYPDNWQVHEAMYGYGVTIAPEGGLVDAGGVELDLVTGVIINHYAPLEGGAGDGRALIAGNTSLIHATNDLLGQILRLNPDMEMVRNSERRDRIDGAESISVVLSGRSPVTRQEERVTVFSREIPDGHVIYALFVAPERDYNRLNETFNRMISSLRVSDRPIHDASAGRSRRDSTSVSAPLVVPTGTAVRVAFQQALSSATSQSGDRFGARVIEHVLVDGRVAIAAGSVISGRVVAVQRPRRIGGGRAQLNLEFTSLRSATGSESPISVSIHGQGEVGSSRSATGTGIQAQGRGVEVTIPEGAMIEIRFDAPLSL